MVASQASPDVEGRAVHIDCQPAYRNGKTGDGNRWLSVAWGDWDLAFWIEAVLLEQLQETKFKRRADASRERFEPRARAGDGVGVASGLKSGAVHGFEKCSRVSGCSSLRR